MRESSRSRTWAALHHRVAAALFLLGIAGIVAGVAVLAGWPVALIVLGAICVAAAVQEVYF